MPNKEVTESFAAQRFAKHLNETLHADYEVENRTQPEPVDRRLVSKSGKHPPVDLQIVRAPLGAGAGSNSHGNLERLGKDLISYLESKGLTDVVISVHTNDSIFSKPLPNHLVGILGDLILSKRPPIAAPYEVCDIELDELFKRNDELGEVVSNVGLMFGTGHEKGFVDFPRAVFCPDDAQLINAAIEKKSEKYDKSSLRSLVLLIDAQWSIDREQVASYRDTMAPGEVGFKEIWILGPFVPPTRLR